MTLKEFLDKYNHVPLDLEEVAWKAEKIEDNKQLKDAARRYLGAKDKLDKALESVGFEFG